MIQLVILFLAIAKITFAAGGPPATSTIQSSPSPTPAGPQPTLIAPGVSGIENAPPNWLAQASCAMNDGSFLLLVGNATALDPNLYIFRYSLSGHLQAAFKIIAPNPVAEGGVSLLSHDTTIWVISNTVLGNASASFSSQFHITRFNSTARAKIFDVVVPLTISPSATSINSLANYASIDSQGAVYVTGSVLISGSDYSTQTVKISSTGKIMWSAFIASGYPTSLSLTVDESLIAVTGLSGVKVYNTTTGEDETSSLAFQQYQQYPYTSTYTSTGSLIAGNNFNIYLQDATGQLMGSTSTAQGTLIKPVPGSKTNDIVAASIAVSQSTGSLSATLSYISWTTKTANIQWTKPLPEKTTTIALFVDSQFVYWIVGLDQQVNLYKYLYSGALVVAESTVLQFPGDAAQTAVVVNGVVWVATIKGSIYKF